jgi:hypothetical protein
MTASNDGGGALKIRTAQTNDESAIWAIIKPVIRAGETYALPRNMTQAEAISYWCGADRETFVADEDGQVVGTYYLRANQLGVRAPSPRACRLLDIMS